MIAFLGRSVPGHRARRTMARWVLVVVAAVAVVACDETPSEPTATPGERPPGSDAPPDETIPDEPDTLAGFLGPAFDPRDPQAAHAYYLAQERRIQERIAGCMRAEGFEYVPVEFGGEVAFDDAAQEETVANRGFGITTWLGDPAGADPERGGFEDPNAGIVAALPDEERREYRRALYGDGEGVETETETDPATGEQVEIHSGFGEGCEGRAYEEEYGGQIAVFEELEPALAELDAAIEADPRIGALRDEWSNCMADAGFSFEDRHAMLEDGVADLHDRLREIVGPEVAGLHPMVDWTEEEIQEYLAGSSDAEIATPAAEEDRLTAEQSAALEQLQGEEIEMAVADLECSRRQADAYAEVSAEYEDTFIDQHRALLERLRSGD